MADRSLSSEDWRGGRQGWSPGFELGGFCCGQEEMVM